eukprot:XP_022268437.1 collagen alpha-1(I) chain-like [Canis lupus familiaris]
MSWYKLVCGARAPPRHPRCRVFAEGTWKPRKRIGSSHVPAARPPPPSPQAPCLSSPSTAPAPLLGPGHPRGRPRPFPSSGVAGLGAAPGSPGRPGGSTTDGGSDTPQPPSAVSPRGVAPVHPFSLNVSKPGFRPRCVQLLAKRPSPQPVPATRAARTGAKSRLPSGAPGWARPAGAPRRLQGRGRRGWRGGGVEGVEGVAAERAPGRCAGEQPGRARPGSGTGCPPREAEAHPTGEAGTCRPSQAGCPPALQAAASVPPSTPHGFQGSVPRLSRLSSLREPRSLQDGAAPASGARGCEATSAQPNAAPPRRSEGNRGTEGVESGCPRPCWLVPVPGPPAQDFLS